MTSALSPKNIEHLRAVVERRGLAAVARTLGVSRSGLGSVLIGRGRQCTSVVIAQAYFANAAQLETL